MTTAERSKPAEARNEDVQLDEERGDGRTAQNAGSIFGRDGDDASGVYR